MKSTETFLNLGDRDADHCLAWPVLCHQGTVTFIVRMTRSQHINYNSLIIITKGSSHHINHHDIKAVTEHASVCDSQIKDT